MYDKEKLMSKCIKIMNDIYEKYITQHIDEEERFLLEDIVIVLEAIIGEDTIYV